MGFMGFRDLKFKICPGYKILQKRYWTTYVTIGKLIKCTMPQFPRYDLENFSTYLLALL